jgi:prophage antirepressor-like protein
VFPETGQQVRVVEIEGAPWFAAKDVCAILGMVKTDRALAALAVDEKGTHPMRTPGGLQRLSVISESGLYKLVMRSDKPQARKLQDWVARDVLPAINKDGVYVRGA